MGCRTVITTVGWMIGYNLKELTDHYPVKGCVVHGQHNDAFCSKCGEVSKSFEEHNTIDASFNDLMNSNMISDDDKATLMSDIWPLFFDGSVNIKELIGMDDVVALDCREYGNADHDSLRFSEEENGTMLTKEQIEEEYKSIISMMEEHFGKVKIVYLKATTVRY